MTFDEILAAIDDAFQCQRPAHLGRDPDHTRDCPECAEHNETMAGEIEDNMDDDILGSAMDRLAARLTDL